MPNRLARVRQEEQWTKARLVHELRRAAGSMALPGDESMKRRIAVWENQDGAVSDFYRELLCAAYGRSAPELGIAGEPEMPSAPATVDDALPIAFTRLDLGVVALLRDHTQSIRMLDRRLGGALTFKQAVAHVEQIEGLLRHALPGAHREAAADELGQAAALAGWQALDMGDVREAWRLHEIATAAAREGGQIAGLAYASAQQGYVLLDAGHAVDAQSVMEFARTLAGSGVPAVLQAWLHAAEAEALAALGQRDGVLRALDAAADALPGDTGDDSLPFVMLDAGHLARWRGHCLARLGDGKAIEDLTDALSVMGEGQYGRAEVGLRVDLALAFAARGDVSESRAHALRGAELAGRTGSERQRRRISQLLAA
ncbi:hypothetical protein [Pseudonocardia broussonetiae]|uniref:Uncharacterized protein n=1 Tax=Pseudonocardia broussonetiae TaxID=2736640 RepID=A0A6M6JB25_9PSEU|nr:hypothetical protein [Pseudonocardia broussonetiae]QJY45138.1 hypothetical protein HOP40_04275 [Pseudonocardia broussonetiae]